MPSKLVCHRKSAYLSQSGRCYYCNLPMWESDVESFTQAYKVSLRQAKLLKCTAEHLDARMDGGKDNANNIVAACHWCNQKRHQRKLAPGPNEYRNMVRQKLRNGRWICKSIAMHFSI